jgi:hypothetical protein
MHLPRFWAKETRSALDPSGKAYKLAVWGWSDTDSVGAHQMALKRLAEVANTVALGGLLNQYSYGGGARPLREPLIQAVTGADALISRNAYGALVLNTARIFFADIDLPQSPTAGLLSSLFGKKAADPAEAALARLRDWHSRQPAWALRVYRTKAGLRLLAMQDQFDPTTADTQKLLASLGSDPLYTTLCRTQACFRARLTPKPWRIGLKAPHWQYPFENSSQAAEFQEWVRRYDATRPRFAVCRLLAELGPHTQTAEAAAVLAIHDQYTCPPGDLPLS